MKNRKEIMECFVAVGTYINPTGSIQKQDLAAINNNLRLILEVLIDIREVIGAGK